MDLETVVDSIASAGLPAAKQCEGLETVRKLLSNIVASPHEEKYRQVRRTNEALQKRLFPQCFDLLRVAGFQDSGDLLVFRGDDFLQLQEVIMIVESLIMSMGGVSQATPSSSSSRPASAATPSASSSSKTPAESKRTLLQKKEEAAKASAKTSQASAQAQLAALRQVQRGAYQECQDVALARHLSSRAADQPFDAVAAMNRSRGATHSFVSCDRCGTSLRYNSETRAHAVLCPCGNLLQPLHLRGQEWRPQGAADLPMEPGEPVDQDEDAPRKTRGPYVTVRGPGGQPMRLPLHSVLRMVRQAEDRQQTGAENDDIAALPTRTYEAGASGSADCTNCQICMEDFAEGEELRTLPCFHLFHSACVDQWLKVNSICPTCRHKIG